MEKVQRYIDFPSFVRIFLKELKGDSASSYLQGLAWSSFTGILDEETLGEVSIPSMYDPY